MRRIVKTSLFLVALSTISSFALAETVKLKITYNGNPAVKHTVHVMYKDASLGSGVTDSNGDVSINVSSLPFRNIDLKGEKVCDGSQKKWSVRGWVTLDENNFYHLKMEEPLNEMAGQMGMTTNMLASSWGLVCSGEASTEGERVSTAHGTEHDPGNNDGSLFSQGQEELMQIRKESLENSITDLENKAIIQQKNLDKEREGLTENEVRLEELEIRKLKERKALKEIELEEQNQKIAHSGTLSRTQRHDYAVRKEDQRAQIDKTSEEIKETKRIIRTEPKDYSTYTNGELIKAKAGLQSELSKLKIDLKFKAKRMDEKTRTEKEARVEVLQAEIRRIKEEQDSRP